ncbi:MAG: chemotaxis protein CheV [Planctomycetes bacterium]|nr:chemotaxis protein CheV [Planctomycetota bacterium]
MAIQGSKAGILLESGTNEVEILEFLVNGQSFGINVAKIQEIVQFKFEALTKMPQQPESIKGGYLIRGKMLLLVDLCQHLYKKPSVVDESNQDFRQVVLVTEFNCNKTGFLLESVNRIHRCTWTQLVPITDYAMSNNIAVLGTINIEGKDIVILDIESVLAHLIPSFDRLDNMDVEHEKDAVGVSEREHCHIIVAEDSNFIREHLVRNLKSIGYTNISEFHDGQAALEAITQIHKKSTAEQKEIGRYINAIVTDIEMPRLDGLSLCHRVRTNLNINNVPVIMFSSLVNEQMQQKCKSVGGNACLNKAEASQLVGLLDQLCLHK